MEHIIKKQTIELNIDQGLDAFQVQHNMSQHYWNDILSNLERIFDEYSKQGEILEIGKIEIDLGSYSEQQLEKGKKDLDALLREQVEKNFNAPSKKLELQKKSRSLSVCQQWLHYMLTGSLPWNTLKIDDQWYEQVLEALATDIPSITLLRKAIINQPQVVKRLYYQHEPATLLKLVEIITAENHNKLLGALDELCLLEKYVAKQLKTKPRSKQQLIQEFWEQILVEAAKNSSGKATTLDIVAPLLAPIVKHYRDFKALPEKLKSALKITSKWYPNFTSAIPEINAEIPAPNEGTVEKFESRDLPYPEPAQNSDPQMEEGIFVSQAGLILVHPFLPNMFTMLNLVNDGVFINKRARHKALLVLHFMATGKKEAPEHDLVISKLLCGVSLGEPVPRKLVLGKKYLEEADFLLKLIITRWEVLKETSPDGLREEFLQRPGKLSTKQGNPYLQLESKTSDMLLDHLPWNIGLIKLPWMKKLLRVEWR